MNDISINILIVDDHAIIRKGISALINTDETIEVIGEANDGKSAIEQYMIKKPDVVLLDLVMPDIGGVEVIKTVIRIDPKAKFIVLTSFASDDQVFSAIKAGALGYLIKDTDPDDLITAIHQVYRGESYLSSVIARKVIQEIFESENKPVIADPLTNRELEVLQVLAKGKKNKDIAELLSISDTTVRKHVSNILAKLHLASRTEAALYAIKEGLTNMEDENLNDQYNN